MIWGSVTEDPHGISFMVNSTKNKKALNQLYSTVVEAKRISNQTILSKKRAAYSIISRMDAREIVMALRFDDPDSEYHALRDATGKQHIEGLAIIFSGAYNKGIPCFPPNLTPYDMLDTNVEYTAILKENWRQMFPTIVMMQRNNCIQKSTLDIFLLLRSKKKYADVSVSSSSSYVTPNAIKDSSCSSTSIKEFDSYIKSNEEVMHSA